MSKRRTPEEVQRHRKDRLATLVTRNKTSTARGGKAALANELGIAPSYLAQLLNTSGDRKKSRPIKEETARDFETRLGLREGWFDAEAESSPRTGTAVAEESSDYAPQSFERQMAIVKEIASTASPAQAIAFAEQFLDSAKSRLQD